VPEAAQCLCEGARWVREGEPAPRDSAWGLPAAVRAVLWRAALHVLVCGALPAAVSARLGACGCTFGHWRLRDAARGGCGRAGGAAAPRAISGEAGADADAERAAEALVTAEEAWAAMAGPGPRAPPGLAGAGGPPAALVGDYAALLAALRGSRGASVAQRRVLCAVAGGGDGGGDGGGAAGEGGGAAGEGLGWRAEWLAELARGHAAALEQASAEEFACNVTGIAPAVVMAPAAVDHGGAHEDLLAALKEAAAVSTGAPRLELDYALARVCQARATPTLRTARQCIACRSRGGRVLEPPAPARSGGRALPRRRAVVPLGPAPAEQAAGAGWCRQQETTQQRGVLSATQRTRAPRVARARRRMVTAPRAAGPTQRVPPPPSLLLPLPMSLLHTPSIDNSYTPLQAALRTGLARYGSCARGEAAGRPLARRRRGTVCWPSGWRSARETRRGRARAGRTRARRTAAPFRGRRSISGGLRAGEDLSAGPHAVQGGGCARATKA
jgi:hypothetical protein